MTKTKKPIAKELPLVKRRIAALLDKTEANGCTPGEADAAIRKARELVKQYKLDPGAFRWPQTASTTEIEPTSESSAPKRSEAIASGRGKGIGRLAAVYLLSLFGFVIWVGLLISWLFFAGVKPPLAS